MRFNLSLLEHGNFVLTVLEFLHFFNPFIHLDITPRLSTSHCQPPDLRLTT
jgi:hypothetical protein